MVPIPRFSFLRTRRTCLGLPQAVLSARINSDWLFRPKLKNPPEAKNYAWSHFSQIHPQDISIRWNPSKTSGTGSFARFTPNYAWSTPSFAWVFVSQENGKMQNAVPFSCRLKISPELGISPAGCPSLRIAKRHILGFRLKKKAKGSPRYRLDDTWQVQLAHSAAVVVPWNFSDMGLQRIFSLLSPACWNMLKFWISSPCAKENRVFGFTAPLPLLVSASVSPWPATPLGIFPDVCQKCLQRISSSLYHRQSILYLPKKNRGCDPAEWQFRRDALVALLTQPHACLSLCRCCKGLEKQEIWLDASLFQYAAMCLPRFLVEIEIAPPDWPGFPPHRQLFRSLAPSKGRAPMNGETRWCLLQVP